MVTHSWDWWYRLARLELGLTDLEAREYADRRVVEDANRERLAQRRRRAA
ncbi:MAG TPA: hypothetical protein VH950_15965 [Gaiellaceae bacterium]|jgi:hypothetical protein